MVSRRRLKIFIPFLPKILVGHRDNRNWWVDFIAIGCRKKS